MVAVAVDVVDVVSVLVVAGANGVDRIALVRDVVWPTEEEDR